MKDKEIIKKLYIDLCNASINKDIKKLNDILSEDYILIHMTGLKQTKKDYINAIINEELKYYEAIHEEINIDINNNIAKVIAKTKTLAAPFGITKSWWRLKQELNMEKVDNKWIIKKSQASTY